MYSAKDLLLSNIYTRSQDNVSLVDTFLRITKLIAIIKNGLEGTGRPGLRVYGSEADMIMKYVRTVRMRSVNLWLRRAKTQK